MNPTGQNVSLLVVDDESRLRESIAADLRKKGYTVSTAPNGKKAYEIIRRAPVDLVITDVRMPGGDGMELLRAIRGDDFELPVIVFVTAFADLDNSDVYQEGAAGILPKPFKRKALHDLVERALMTRPNRWNTKRSDGSPVHALNLQFDGFDQARSARIIEIGHGGMFVALNQDFPKESSLVSFQLNFTAGGCKQVEGTGLVRWVRAQKVGASEAGCGIEFLELSEPSRSWVLDLISRERPTAFIPKK